MTLRNEVRKGSRPAMPSPSVSAAGGNKKKSREPTKGKGKHPSDLAAEIEEAWRFGSALGPKERDAAREKARKHPERK